MSKCPVIEKGKKCPAMNDRSLCVISKNINIQKNVSNCVKNQRKLYRRQKDWKLAKTNHRLWNALFAGLYIAAFLLVNKMVVI